MDFQCYCESQLLIFKYLTRLNFLGDLVNSKSLSTSIQELSNLFFQVRENILFGSGFEAARYWKAIDVTEFRHDLDLLPVSEL